MHCEYCDKHHAYVANAAIWLSICTIFGITHGNYLWSGIMIIYRVSALVICQIYITRVSCDYFVHEKSQLLTDPHDVSLTHNQCRYMINYVNSLQYYQTSKMVDVGFILDRAVGTNICLVLHSINTNMVWKSQVISWQCGCFQISSFMKFWWLYTPNSRCWLQDECQSMDTDYEIADYGYNMWQSAIKR